MSAKNKSISSVRAGDAHEKPTDKLSVKEFRDRFCIPNSVIVEFLNGEDVVSIEKVEGRAITFSKEQFNAGLRFPLPTLFKEFLHFSQIPPAFIDPNIVRVLMGCNIINMLFNLDLTLLEVLFVYSLKKGKNDIFSMAAHLPSLQLVTELPDSTKGGAKGYVVVRGAWAGVIGASGRLFLQTTQWSGKEGPHSDWVEKTSFACLNKLFEIDARERHYGMLLTARNLMAVDLPIYKEVKEADAEKRRALLDDREKRKNEGTLRKAPGQKRSAASSKESPNEKEEAGDFNKPARFSPSGWGCSRGYLCGGSSSYGDPTGGDESRKPESTFWRVEPCRPCSGEGASFKRSCSARNLKSDLIGRLQDRFQEIEVSCSSAQDAHPEGSEVEMATETPAVPVVVPDEGVPGETHSAENVEAPDPEEESPSNASSGGILLMMQLSSLLTLLVTQSLARHGQQHDLFTDLLRTADYMKAFASQRENSEDQLRLRLEEAEATQKEELEGEFAADREALEADYQKQVDDMFFFGYRCCMKKNGIKRDVPSIPRRTIFEASGPYFAIVMGGCSLLIVCHPDGCAFPYFICPIQVSSQLCVCIVLLCASVRMAHRTPGSSSTHFPLACSSLFFKAVIRFCLWLLLARYFEDNAVWSMNSGIQLRTEIPECDAVKLWTIVSYDGLWNSKTADDVFPYELGDIFVFDASICFSFHPFTEAPKVGPVKDRLYKCPPIKVKRAACTGFCVPVWDLRVECLSGDILQYCPSILGRLLGCLNGVASEVSATEGLVCTYIAPCAHPWPRIPPGCVLLQVANRYRPEFGDG
ncbi:hypothetical protein CK203_043517 [Vitis vinifera]|uniref:Uncharacterized protein n=1 Tax=Vitis vinifera TaxID=29760 RepID=A0A438HRA6_VITVI|nr:hypothetical protein CK203_043517 [Vitis vinifera]